MTIAPFSFREFGASEVEHVSAASPRPFLPTGRKPKEEAAPPPPPPPTFSEEELKGAERDGYQKGFIDGIVEGKNQAESTQAEVDRVLSATVEAFSNHLDPMFSIYREMLVQQAKLLPQIAQTIAKKVAGESLTSNAYTSIEEICLRCVNAMFHEPKLLITVHESMAGTLEAKIAHATKSMQSSGEISIVGDANIAPPNCRIEWKNGAMIRDTEQLWQQIEQVIASMSASDEREASTLCDQLEQLIVQTPIVVATPVEEVQMTEEPPVAPENE
jgi:flagellar assembly protein FliH